MLSMMATDIGKNENGRATVGSSIIKSPEEAAEVLRGFKSALKLLTCEHGFQSLAELVDRIPKLEAEIEAKEKTLRLANEAAEREKAAQEDMLRKNLQLYQEDVAKIRKQMDNLEKKSTGLETKISEKDEVIAKLQDKEAALKEGGRKLEDKCRSLKTTMKMKEGEITQLQQQNQDSHVRIGSLTAELKKSQVEVNSKNKSLSEMSEQRIQLEKALGTARDQQDEMASYAVSLKNVDLDQL